MSGNTLNVVDRCLTIAEKCDSLQVINYISEEKELLNEHRSGNILIVGQDSENLLECVIWLLNREELNDLNLSYVDKAFKLKFSYGENFKCAILQDNNEKREFKPGETAAEISNCGRNVVPSIEITLNSDRLKAFDITVINSYDGFKEFLWKKELGNADFAFLLTNATAPMNMYERNFLDKSLKKYLGAARIGIVAARMEYINSLSDREEIILNIRSIMLQSGISGDLLYTDNESLEKFIYSYVSENLAELHKLRDVQIAAACVDEIEKLIDEKEKEASFDAITVKELIEEMKLKKKDITEMGSVAAESTRADIKFSLSENFLKEVDSYNYEIIENIEKGIKNADDIAKVKDKISDFIENAWQIFLKEKSPWIEDTVKSALEKSYDKMESDVSEFFVDVSDDKKELLEFLFEDPQDITGGTSIGKYNMPETQPNKLTAISKIILLSSIPLTFIANPVVGVVTAASGVVLKKYSKSKFEDDSREGLLKVFKDICINYKTEIYNSCCRKFGYLADEAANAVIRAYGKFTDNLISRLNGLYENTTRLNCRIDEMKQIRDEEIPELKSAIML